MRTCQFIDPRVWDAKDMRAVANLRTVLRGRLLRNTGTLLLGHVGRVAIQGTFFVLAARELGVTTFGAFAAAVALTALISPFAAFGAPNLLVRNSVRAPSETASHLATAVTVVTIGGLVAMGVLVSASSLVAPPELTALTLCCIAAADLLGARLVETAGAAFAASERMAQTAGFTIALHAARTLSAIALVFATNPMSLEIWAYGYAGSSVAMGIAAVSIARHSFGASTPNLGQFRREWWDGMLFSVGLASQSIYNDLDKAMLAKLASLDATGLYTAAYRIVDMALAPLRALLSAAYPRFFLHGQKGIRDGLAFARRLAPVTIGYGVAAALGLLLLADAVPLVLGNEYSDAVPIIRALAVLPLLKALQSLPSDVLTGAGHQGFRSLAQIGAALVNVALNVALIPSHGLWGAVAATLLTDLLLLIAVWAVVAAIVRKS